MEDDNIKVDLITMWKASKSSSEQFSSQNLPFRPKKKDANFFIGKIKRSIFIEFFIGIPCTAFLLFLILSYNLPLTKKLGFVFFCILISIFNGIKYWWISHINSTPNPALSLKEGLNDFIYKSSRYVMLYKSYNLWAGFIIAPFILYLLYEPIQKVFASYGIAPIPGLSFLGLILLLAYFSFVMIYFHFIYLRHIKRIAKLLSDFDKE